VLVLNEMVLVHVAVSSSTSTANAEYEYEKPRGIAKRNGARIELRNFKRREQGFGAAEWISVEIPRSRVGLVSGSCTLPCLRVRVLLTRSMSTKNQGESRNEMGRESNCAISKGASEGSALRNGLAWRSLARASGWYREAARCRVFEYEYC
jgi:hypothetical protein